MNLKILDDLLRRLCKKPIRTTLLIILMIIVFCIAAFLSGLFEEKGKQAASFLSNPDSYIKTNREKLLKFVRVEGDSIIINEVMGEKILKAIEKRIEYPWEEAKYANQVQLYEDVTEYINLTLHSERFGSAIRFKVPAAMKVWALLELIIEGLCLPKEIKVEELGISFEFTYDLISEGLLENHNTLLESGLKNGADLSLKIDVVVRDSEAKEMENELHLLQSTVFAISPGEEWYNYIEELAQKVEKTKKKLYEKYAEDFLKEAWFAHLENR